LRLNEVKLTMFLWWELHREVAYYRNQDYGISLKQIGVVVSEIAY